MTTVVDMPCTSLPPVTTAANLRNKLAVVAPKAHVDFLFWGGVSGNSIREGDWRRDVADLVSEGVGAFKLYLLSGMETYRDLSPDEIREVLCELSLLGVPAGIHAEDRALVLEATERLRSSGDDTPRAYAASRPAAAEVAAVATMRRLCRETGAQVHIVHLASGEALAEVEAARREGLRFSAETCPHYLAFTDGDLDRLGALLKTAPVVKGAADREALWRGLASGSDPARGDRPRGGGVAAREDDRVDLERLRGRSGCRADGPVPLLGGCADRPNHARADGRARVVGAGPLLRGRQAEGAARAGVRCRLLCPRPGRERGRWIPRRLHNLNRYSPFAGQPFTGRVVATVVRGQTVYDRRADGTETFLPPGTGRFLKREERFPDGLNAWWPGSGQSASVQMTCSLHAAVWNPD